MGTSIQMVAHCLFHQTARWERLARCEDCGGELRESNGSWFCAGCLTSREPDPCPICTGQPWN